MLLYLVQVDSLPLMRRVDAKLAWAVNASSLCAFPLKRCVSELRTRPYLQITTVGSLNQN